MKRIFNRLQNTHAVPRRRVILLALASALQALLQVGMALASRYVIDSALTGNGKLLLWGGILFGDLLALLLIHTLTVWLTNSTSDNAVALMQQALLRTVIGCAPETLSSYHSGSLLSRGLEDVRTVCDGMVRVLPNLLGQIMRLAGAFAAVLLICPQLAPVFLIAGLVIALISASFRPLAKKLHKRVRKADETVTAGLQENFQQTSLIQSLQMERQVLLHFEDKVRRSLKAKFKRRLWTVGVNSVVTALSLLGTGALLLWGAVQVAKGDVSYGVLTAMVQLLSLFRAPLLGISGSWTQLAAVDVADGRLQELLGKERSVPADSSEPLHVQSVVFENVTFRYPEDRDPVLTNFSAELPLDRWACLTGTSGIGKTTLYKLILGLYQPQEGRVFLQTDRGEVPCSADTRHLFAYVPQDYALFSGTILENMELVAPDADAVIRQEAYRIACADFVESLSDKEQTHVFENNAGLSMGQMQRLAIARAVLMERPILLLDECTSALDAQTERQVLENLQKMGTQAIVVTHHPEALKDAPEIVHVDM